jgi:hypothetical protein
VASRGTGCLTVSGIRAQAPINTTQTGLLGLLCVRIIACTSNADATNIITRGEPAVPRSASHAAIECILASGEVVHHAAL